MHGNLRLALSGLGLLVLGSCAQPLPTGTWPTKSSFVDTDPAFLGYAGYVDRIAQLEAVERRPGLTAFGREALARDLLMLGRLGDALEQARLAQLAAPVNGGILALLLAGRGDHAQARRILLESAADCRARAEDDCWSLDGQGALLALLTHDVAPLPHECPLIAKVGDELGRDACELLDFSDRSPAFDPGLGGRTPLSLGSKPGEWLSPGRVGEIEVEVIVGPSALTTTGNAALADALGIRLAHASPTFVLIPELELGELVLHNLPAVVELDERETSLDSVGPIPPRLALGSHVLSSFTHLEYDFAGGELRLSHERGDPAAVPLPMAWMPLSMRIVPLVRLEVGTRSLWFVIHGDQGDAFVVNSHELDPDDRAPKLALAGRAHDVAQQPEIAYLPEVASFFPQAAIGHELNGRALWILEPGVGRANLILSPGQPHQ